MAPVPITTGHPAVTACAASAPLADPWRRIDGGLAATSADHWFPISGDDDSACRGRLCAIYRLIPGREFADLSRIPSMEMRRQIAEALRHGSIVAWNGPGVGGGGGGGGEPTVERVAAAASSAAPAEALAPPSPAAAEAESAVLTDMVAKAQSWQGKGAYPGVDEYQGQYVEPGTILVSGAPGQSAYYSTPEDLAGVGMSRSRFFQGLQVAAHPQFGYRPKATYYRVTRRCPAAVGAAKANPQYGAGGLTQYYIEDYASCLEPIQTVDLLP